MSPEGRTLYAGLRKRRDGFEFVMPDRVRALVQVGRCLGMFRRDDAGADGDTYEKLLDDLG